MHKKFYKVFFLFLFLGSFLSCSAQKEVLKTHLFSYKGFEIKLLDFAQDETGNYLCVETVKATEMLAENRDSLLNSQLGRTSDKADFSDRGMMFYTNSNFELLRI